MLKAWAIALAPLERGMGAQPYRSDHAEGIEGCAQRFPHEFQAVQGADRPKDMCRVRTLAPPGFDHAHGLQAFQYQLKEATRGLMVDQPSPKLAENRVIEARISQL